MSKIDKAIQKLRSDIAETASIARSPSGTQEERDELTALLDAYDNFMDAYMRVLELLGELNRPKP